MKDETLVIVIAASVAFIAWLMRQKEMQRQREAYTASNYQRIENNIRLGILDPTRPIG